MTSEGIEPSAEFSGNLALSWSNSDDAFIRAPNQAYGGEHGYVYTAHSIQRVIKSRRTIAIKLTTTYKPIEIRSKQGIEQFLAVAIKPMVPREIRASNAGIVVAVLSPKHAKFRNFSTAPGPGLMRLDRNEFCGLDDRLQQTYLGKVDASGALALLEDIVAIAVRQLPEPPALDGRVTKTIELLRDNAKCDLEELAEEVGVSYYRLSHLFSQQMGLSLRTYHLWKKMDRAWRLISAGDGIQDVAYFSGFSDVAHFCRVFRDSYGVPVSYVLNKVRPKTMLQ